MNAGLGGASEHGRVAAAGRSRVDLRLVPVAVGLWAGEAAVLLRSGRDAGPGAGAMAGAVVGVALAVALGAWAAGVARGWKGRSAGATRSAAGSAAFALALAMGVGALLAREHASALTADPLPELVRSRAVVTAEVVVVSAPKYSRTTSKFGGPGLRWRLRANTVLLSEGAAGWRVRVPVVVTGYSTSTDPEFATTPGTHLALIAAVTKGSPARPEAIRLASRGPPRTVGEAPWWQQRAATVRESLRGAVSGLPADAKGLLPGLADGDESMLPPDLADAMRSVGMSHLTAVSGSNLALVTGFVLLLLRRFRVRRSLAVGAAMLAMVGFVVVVGPEPSVERAAVMGAIALLSIGSGRARTGSGALAAAVVIMLLVDPWLSLAWGFALSVVATGGLVAWSSARGWTGSMRAGSGGRPRTGWRRLAREAVAIAVVCQLATAPLVAAMGGGIPVAGIPANAIVSPVVPVATIAGLAAAIVGMVSPTISGWLATIGGYCASWIALVARTAEGLPVGVLPWPDGLFGGLSLAVVVGCGLGALWAGRRTLIAKRLRSRWGRAGGPWKAVAAVVVACAIASLLVRGASPAGGWPPATWAVVFCDVGQGDATVVRTSPGHAVVIDVGPEPKPVDRCLRELGVSAIDLLVLTHFHADHVEGLPGVLRARAVGRVVVSPLRDPPGEARRVDGLLAEAGLVPENAAVGEAGQIGELRYRVVWPARFLRSGSAANNASVSLVVESGGIVVLLPGDLESEAQQALMDSQAGPNAAVTKIPHHGSRNQDSDLVAWSGSKIAVASAGQDNEYGHPSPATLDAWRRVGAAVMRTDVDGDVAVYRADGGEVAVEGRAGGR